MGHINSKYKINDYVIYNSIVCQIESIGQRDNEEVFYYLIRLHPRDYIDRVPESQLKKWNGTLNQ